MQPAGGHRWSDRRDGMCDRKGCGAGSLRKGYVMAVRLDNRQADFEARFETLLAAKREATVDVAEGVAAIIA